jgi:gas vesicle protein
MIKREESRHDFAFLAGVVIGAVAGAMATLAMSPSTGAEARDKLRARMNELDVEGMKERARNAANTGAERVKGIAGEDSGPGQIIASTKAKVTDLVERSPLPVGGKDGDLSEDAELAADRPRSVREAEPFEQGAASPATGAGAAETARATTASGIPSVSSTDAPVDAGTASAMAESQTDDAMEAAQRPREVHEAEPFESAVREAEEGAEDAVRRATDASEENKPGQS